MKAQEVTRAFEHFAKGDRDKAFDVLRMIAANEKAANRHSVANGIERIIKDTRQLVALPNAPKSLDVVPQLDHRIVG